MVRNGKSARQRTLEPDLGAQADVKTCDWEGCTEAAEFRAPKSPLELNSYRWFCLQHIREYNAKWNFYAGMSEAEIEADLRRDTVWQRPTWPFGKATDGFQYHRARVRTAFGDIDDDPGGESPNAGPGAMEPKLRRALVVLDLDPPVSVTVVKARYKELVKRHHPDANGGDKASEERFKEINEAYHTVMDGFAS